jgi:hypothetical protein
MTINEARYQLDYCIRDMIEQKSRYDDKAIDIAVKSLEAWKSVRQEINDLFSKPACYIPNYDAYETFAEIIDKHMKEVEV